MKRIAAASLSVAAILLVIAGAALGQPSASEPAPCLYGFEWIHAVRFPLQPDPHAAYSYVVPTLPTDGSPVGFLVDAEFPYSAWFSWTVYGARARAFSLGSEQAILPDAGSTNPFVPGHAVFARSRHYRLLLVPDGVSVAPSLADIPNRLPIPDLPTFVIAYRVYQAFPGYNLGGASGPTHTPFPSVFAVNYDTGEKIDCSGLNAVPPTIGRLPGDTPEIDNLYGSEPTREPPGAGPRAVANAERLFRIPAMAELTSMEGWAFAPVIDPELVTFTRPPVAPGADVSSVPPPDQCSGYLGARVDPDRIALIRIPHIPSILETAALDPDMTYPDPTTRDAAYVSLAMYGDSINTYEPGDPTTTSVADSEFQPDATGGATIVVWPRHLPLRERERLFTHARRQGWVLIRGGSDGPVTTANLLLRLKAASPGYYGGYTPVENGRTGVLCYFNDAPPGVRWTDVEDAADPLTYVASFQNLGNAAPQGVHCQDVEDVLGGGCLTRLKAHIEETGGRYFNPGHVPPPTR